MGTTQGLAVIYYCNLGLYFRSRIKSLTVSSFIFFNTLPDFYFLPTAVFIAGKLFYSRSIITSHLLNNWACFRPDPPLAEAFLMLHPCFVLKLFLSQLIREHRGIPQNDLSLLTSCLATKDCFFKDVTCAVCPTVINTHALLSRPHGLTFPVWVSPKLKVASLHPCYLKDEMWLLVKTETLFEWKVMLVTSIWL